MYQIYEYNIEKENGHRNIH